jgi:hypothetical protein
MLNFPLAAPWHDRMMISRRLARLGITVAVLGTLAACDQSDSVARARPLLIAPVLEAANFCSEAVGNASITNDDEAALLCASKGTTGAPLISAALEKIGPKLSPSGRYELGYTLAVPLFRYFQVDHGHWKFDAKALAANLGVITEVNRRVVVYLSANHFTDAGVQLSRELASDPRNLMWSRNGPMRPDDYFSHPVIAWTLTDREAPITQMRVQAFRAALEAVCALPAASREKIAGVSLLGESHDLFPNFVRGPSFQVPMHDASDYSPVAVQGFRDWLKGKYLRIGALNKEIDAGFGSFDEITPPSKDIRTEALKNFFEHIDTYAAGRVPVYGWIHDDKGRPLKLSVYLDGQEKGVAATGLSRTDVLEAVPAFKDPNLGFRFDLDFRDVPFGIHTLEVRVSADGAAPVTLATRQLAIIDRKQSTPQAMPTRSGNALAMASDASLKGNLDGPEPNASAFYNPLARLWLEYRNKAVRDYVEYYASLAENSCLAKEKIYSHQITPALTGSWNGDLMAADASKLPGGSFVPGTTLYGGAAFGPAFVEMRKRLGWTHYAVNEMHPIVSLAPAQYLDMFAMHRNNGADFVAPYYLSLTPERLVSGDNDLTRFKLSSTNTAYGSNAYLQSIKDAMRD